MKLKMERSVYNRQGKKTVLPQISVVKWPKNQSFTEQKIPFKLEVVFKSPIGLKTLVTVITKNPVTGDLVINGISPDGYTFVARIKDDCTPYLELFDERGNPVLIEHL